MAAVADLVEVARDAVDGLDVVAVGGFQQVVAGLLQHPCALGEQAGVGVDIGLDLLRARRLIGLADARMGRVLAHDLVGRAAHFDGLGLLGQDVGAVAQLAAGLGQPDPVRRWNIRRHQAIALVVEGAAGDVPDGLGLGLHDVGHALVDCRRARRLAAARQQQHARGERQDADLLEHQIHLLAPDRSPRPVRQYVPHRKFPWPSVAGGHSFVVTVNSCRLGLFLPPGRATESADQTKENGGWE